MPKPVPDDQLPHGVPVLRTVGDSHCKWSFIGVPGVHAHWLGPVTMHRIGRDGLDLSEVPNDGRTLLCFGEIDVRCHLGVHSQDHPGGTSGVISDLSGKFLQAALNCGRRVAVMSVVPPAYVDSTPQHWDLPVHGSDEDRSLLTRELNESLRMGCLEHGLEYLDVHAAYADEDGMLPPELSDGNVHIGDPSRLRKLLEEMKWA